jgi:hypothetical protein
VKKAVLVLLIVLAMLLTACGGSNGVSSEKQVLSEEQAQEVLLAKLDAENSSDFTVYLLREASLGEAIIYAFERVGNNGGAATVDFVHSETGEVYFNSHELLLDEFKKSEAQDQYKNEKYIDSDIYYLSMKSINDPEERNNRTGSSSSGSGRYRRY